MEQVSELIEVRKDSASIIKSLIEKRKISTKTLQMMRKSNMCEIYGWTSEEYDNTDLEIIDSFSAIQRGRAIGSKRKMEEQMRKK